MPRKQKKNAAVATKISPRDAVALECFHRLICFLVKHQRTKVAASTNEDENLISALTSAAKRCRADSWHATIHGYAKGMKVDPRDALRPVQVRKWITKSGGMRPGTFGSILCGLNVLSANCARKHADFDRAYEKLLGEFAGTLHLPRNAISEIRTQLASRAGTGAHQRSRAIGVLSNERELSDQGEINRATERYAGVWLAMRLRTRDHNILRFPLWIESEPASNDMPRVTLVASNSADDAYGVLIPASSYFTILIFRGRGANRGDAAVKSFAFYRDRTAGPAADRARALTLGGLYMGPSHRRDAIVARHAILEECLDARADSLEGVRERLNELDLLSTEIGPKLKPYDNYLHLLSHEHYGKQHNGDDEIPLYLSYNDFEERLTTHGETPRKRSSAPRSRATRRK
ncbi:MAG: hypothetical protein K8S25_18030 [Alphaproteobacteria bacterium]|nr:hypothetical protein [Alphaproteobacteria bacterium]